MYSSESGRSMIEILGVLAVMGILSVAGVKAYTYAMNKHRANELINEANKRAVVVASQIMAGRDRNSLSISEFQNPTGYTFGVESNPKNANQFNITIDIVDSSICQQMKSSIGTGGTIRLVSEDCSKLTFNNDLSKTLYPSDIQIKEVCEEEANFWCGGGGTCTEQQQNCCVGKHIGECEICSEGAIVTSPMEGQACDYDGNGTKGDGVCHLGKCDLLPQNVSCDNEGNCSCTNGGQLCNRATGLCCAPNDGSVLSEICTTNGDVSTTDETKQAKCLRFTGNGTDCSTNADCPAETPWCKITLPDGYAGRYATTEATGKCTEIGTVEEATVYGLGRIIIGPSTNWWNAKNWCEANGKKLINIEAFHVYYPTGTHAGELVTTASSSGVVPACRQGKVCERWDNTDAKAMWKYNSNAKKYELTDAKNANGELYSSL